MTDALDAQAVEIISNHRQANSVDVRWISFELDWVHYWMCSCGFEIETTEASPYWYEEHLTEKLKNAGLLKETV